MTTEVLEAPEAKQRQFEQIKAWKISKLKPFPKNPRKHPQKEINLLVKNIEKFGFTNPILVQKSTGYIIAGHARVKAAEKAGYKSVPVISWDVNDEDAMAHMIGDNFIQMMSEWDIPFVKDCLAELDGRSYDIEHTGFTDLNVDVLLSHNSGSDFLKDTVTGENPRDDIEKTPDDVKNHDPLAADHVKLLFVLLQDDRDFIMEYLRDYAEKNALETAGQALVILMRDIARA